MSEELKIIKEHELIEIKSELSDIYALINEAKDNIIDEKNSFDGVLSALYGVHQSIKSDKNSTNDITNSLVALQNEVQKSLNKSELIQIKQVTALTNFDKRIQKNINNAVENLPLEKLKIDILDKIKWALLTFENTQTDLNKAVENMKKARIYAKSTSDYFTRMIKFNQKINDNISKKMAKINIFFGAIAGAGLLFLVQNYKIIEKFALNFDKRNVIGFLIFVSVMVNIGVGSYFIYNFILKKIKKDEDKKYIV